MAQSLVGLLVTLLTAAFATGCASPVPTNSVSVAPSEPVTSTAPPTPTSTQPSAGPTNRPTSSASASASPTTPALSLLPGEARTFTSDDGLLTIDVPTGAVADAAALSATARGEADLPPELHGLEIRSAFYELAPGDVEFAAPVLITRRISFHDLRIDPADGMPILVLAVRSADGAWQWLSDQSLDRDGEDVVVTGSASHSGTIFAFGGRASTKSEVSDAGPVRVGESLRVSATLTVPDDSFDPPLLGVFEPIVEADFVQAGDADGPDNQNLGQSFICLGAGSTIVGVRYSVLNIGAESALFEQLGLQPAATEVEATTQLTCAQPNASAAP